MERPWLAFYEKGIPPHLEYPNIPVHKILEDAVRDFPKNDAVIFLG